MLLDLRANLCDEREFASLTVEDVDLIVRHLLLSDEDLLATIDDEVATLVEGALIELTEIVLHRVLNKHAVFCLEHDRDFPEKDLLVLPLFPYEFLVIAVGFNALLPHVDKERRTIGQIPQPRLPREEIFGAPIRLGVDAFGDEDLVEFDLILGGES